MPLPGVILAGAPWIARIAAAVLARIKAASLLEWVAAGGSVVSLVDTLMEGDLKKQAGGIIVEEVAKRAGLNLDPDEPFGDASIAGALSAKIGITIRSVKDRAMIEEDIEDFAVGRVSEKLGFPIRSLRDPVMLRQDFEGAALAMVAQRTGIPFVPPAAGENLDAEAVKAQVLDWARAKIALEAAQSQAAAIAALSGNGVDFEAIAATLNGKLEAIESGDRVTAGRLALRCAETLVSESAAQLQRTAMGATKRTRRQLQLREAQQKFRAAHGNRQVYVPLAETMPDYSQPVP